MASRKRKFGGDSARPKKPKKSKQNAGAGTTSEFEKDMADPKFKKPSRQPGETESQFKRRCRPYLKFHGMGICMKCNIAKPQENFYTGRNWECKSCRIASAMMYQKSAKGKETQGKARRKYRKSAKGKETLRKAQRKYEQSLNGKESRKEAKRRYNESPRGQRLGKARVACASAVKRMIEQAKMHGKRQEDCPLEMPGAFDNMDDVLGCTAEYAYDHLAQSGKNGETWDHHGVQKEGGPKKCHVDHIMPLASLGDSTKKEEWLRINHWSNLQLLWADTNQAKGDHIPKNWTWCDVAGKWEGEPESWRD